MIDQAIRHMNESAALLQQQVRNAAFHRACNAKAVEIAEFLQRDGENLDAMGYAALVNALGVQVDRLVAAARGSLDAAMESPLAAFTNSLGNDLQKAGNFSLMGGAAVLILVVIVLVLRAR